MIKSHLQITTGMLYIVEADIHIEVSLPDATTKKCQFVADSTILDVILHIKVRQILTRCSVLTLIS